MRGRLVTASVRYAPRFQRLQRIGWVYRTDKATHRYNGKTYLHIYENYLRERRRRRFTLLELGVYYGASLRTWQAYLQHATVVGLDIDPTAVERAPDFSVYTGSQADRELIDRVWREHPDIEVVVDDASHINSLSFAAFDLMFQRLPSGGLYIIEDLAPSAYGPDWPGTTDANTRSWGRRWPGMDRNQDLSLLDNRREDLDAFRNRIAYDCDRSARNDALRGDVAFVHHWPSILIIGRV